MSIEYLKILEFVDLENEKEGLTKHVFFDNCFRHVPYLRSKSNDDVKLGQVQKKHFFTSRADRARASTRRLGIIISRPIVSFLSTCRRKSDTRSSARQCDYSRNSDFSFSSSRMCFSLGEALIRVIASHHTRESLSLRNYICTRGRTHGLDRLDFDEGA